jgi:hypothetical protein
MSESLDSLARRATAFESVDLNDFQRRARILQSLWRIEKGFPIGHCGDRELGSRLPFEWAKKTLANFLDETIRDVVKQEALDKKRKKGKLIQERRLVSDLLSSQPLAFNLFAHLARDTDLASRVFEKLSAGRCRRVLEIDFEYSPGRRDMRYTGDSSAFDVYVKFETRDRNTGFVGIEVKYHENLRNAPAEHRDRYDEVTKLSNCFDAAGLAELKTMPLQQIWRDHLLACSHRLHDHKIFRDGFFAFLCPEKNAACTAAIGKYLSLLSNADTCVHWSMDRMIDILREEKAGVWVDAFHDRYLNFSKIDRYFDAPLPESVGLR